MAWIVYQWPIYSRREGSIGTIIYFRAPHLLKKKEEVGGEMARRYWNINLEEMMEAGIHFGHGTRKWNPRVK